METSPTPSSFGSHAAKRLCSILKNLDAQAVEEALVRLYVRFSPSPRPQHNEELLRLLNDHSGEAQSIDAALIDAGILVTTIDDLVKAFEILVPTVANGGGPASVFTPGWVAATMAKEAITSVRGTSRVIDPSCGCGALLVAALRRLYDINGGCRSAEDIIANQIHGVDIDAAGIRRVRLLLSLVAVELGSDVPVLDFGDNLVCRNSLELSTWESELGGYDVIIGNPPYIRYHELSISERDEYSKQWSVLAQGNFNLYFAFFELAHKLCAPGGVIAYITPNGYFRAASAKPLRRWMVAEMRPTKIMDFGGETVFEGAMTYTAMTFADRATPSTKLLYAECPATASFELPQPKSCASIPLASLGEGVWRLVGKKHQEGIGRAQHGGRPLLAVADVKFGVATLRDRLYLLDGTAKGQGLRQRYDDETFEIETDATRLAVRVSDVATQDALDKCATRILFPYTYERNGRALVWDDDQLLAHPGAHAYLKAIEDELAARDHGKKTYAAWFAYGRTQGLADWTGERLLTPLYANRPRFLRDNKPGRIFLNGCAITPRADSGVSIDLLQALLNSGVLHYFIEQTSSPITGGFYSYQKGPLGSFHIHDDAVARSSDILAASGEERQALIADIYGINLPKKYLAAAAAC